MKTFGLLCFVATGSVLITRGILWLSEHVRFV
jgi:hypothetical protein